MQNQDFSQPGRPLGERPAHQTISITPQVMLRAGRRSHDEGSLIVSRNIEGVMCPMVVNTNANVTLVRSNVLSK